MEYMLMISFICFHRSAAVIVVVHHCFCGVVIIAVCHSLVFIIILAIIVPLLKRGYISFVVAFVGA